MTSDERNRIKYMSVEEAVREMANAAGMTLAEASRRMGKNSDYIGCLIRLTRASRRRGASHPCGMKTDTLAAAAHAMGYRLALVGHGEVIEVVSGTTAKADREEIL